MIKITTVKSELFGFLKFIGVGCINVLIDIGIFAICHWIGLPAYQAQLAGVSFGLFSSYILNRLYTFKDNSPFFGTNLFKFALLSLICVPTSSIGINYLNVTLKLGTWVSKLIVTCIVGLFNYIMGRLFIFRSLRKQKWIKYIMNTIYRFNTIVRHNLRGQVVFITAFSVFVDLCMYFYLSYAGLDSYKSQPLCVVGGLVCCYLLTLKFLRYKIEHFVGFFFVSVFVVMICSPIMYMFEIRFALNALFAKIPTTICITFLAMLLCRFIVYRDVFESEK